MGYPQRYSHPVESVGYSESTHAWHDALVPQLTPPPPWETGGHQGSTA
jgi:hypothetical protein